MLNSDKILKEAHYITSSFGYRTNPITKKKQFHYGTDYGTNGKNIATYPIKGGTVYSTGYHKEMGNYIIIKYSYNGVVYYSRSQHLKSISVLKNQYVDNNTIIGYVGTTGSSTGVHLDFRLYKGGYGDKYAINFETWEEPKEEQYGIVTTNLLNVRDGASILAKFVNYPSNTKNHTLKQGTRVRIGGKQGNWYNIYYGDHGGWVSATYIKLV